MKIFQSPQKSVKVLHKTFSGTTKDWKDKNLIFFHSVQGQKERSSVGGGGDKTWLGDSTGGRNFSRCGNYEILV